MDSSKSNTQHPGRILLVEDDPAIMPLVQHTLEGQHLQVQNAPSLRAARKILNSQPIDLVLLDLGLPDGDGRELLDELSSESLAVVVLTAQTESTALEDCLARGAQDFVPKPFDPVRLRASVANALRLTQQGRALLQLTGDLRPRRGLEKLVGPSDAMAKVRDLLRKAARAPITVLLTGESGTGKEVAAQALHEESSRSAGPFIPINCAAIPEALIESELFGHEKGAFTGAQAARQGCFEQAQGGTIFLDEVGDLPLPMQGKLLRVLQEQEVMRVGGSEPIGVDVRVVAATNRNLEKDLSMGLFRMDLFYRLAVFPVHLPPLRERMQDLTVLTHVLLDQLAREHGREPHRLAVETMRQLQSHNWPGNVRELRNALERGLLMEDSTVIFPPSILLETSATNGPNLDKHAPPVFKHPQTKDELLPLATIERLWLREALDLCDWNIRDVARRLEVGRATIARRIEAYGWEEPVSAGGGEADSEVRNSSASLC